MLKLFKFNKNYSKILINAILYKFFTRKVNPNKNLLLKSRFYKNLRPFTWIPIYSFILPFSGDKKPDLKEIIKEADELYNENRYDDVCKLLEEYKDSNEVEILWRLGRALYFKSKNVNTYEKNELIRVGYDLLHKALLLEENNFAIHKWYSILVDAKANTEGTTNRIKQLINVKNHMLRAVELNPNDATTYYMLGEWCFGIASLSWHQRKIASTFFAAPPTSSFEEALFYFTKAEEIKNNFYSKNLLMLGKTYLMLNNNEKAIYYLELASKFFAKTDEDHQVNREALSLLKKLKTSKE